MRTHEMGRVNATVGDGARKDQVGAIAHLSICLQWFKMQDPRIGQLQQLGRVKLQWQENDPSSTRVW